MCTVCGCETPSAIHAAQGQEEHHHHGHHHDGGDHHTHAPLDFGAGPAGLAIAGLSQDRIIRIEHDILAKNDAFAAANRRCLQALGVFCVNLLSSPGSGKTSLLVRMIADRAADTHIAVIEGDQQTSHDAERIRAAGAPAVQINTGKACHLDAHMVGHAMQSLPLHRGTILFIENVGNLVCPAAFDLGEAHKIVVFSVTEGEDKPLKYPAMFAAADLMLLNKTDLLPYVDFDTDACVAAARRINPGIETIMVSAKTGAGLPDLASWLAARAHATGCVT